MQHAEATSAQKESLSKYKPWGALMAAAMAGIALFNIVVFNVKVNQAPTEWVSVEWHGYETTTQTNKEKLVAQKVKHYQNYQNAKTVAALQSTRPATIQSINGDWALLDCEQNMIKISEQLVAHLKQQNRVSVSLAEGDTVQLALNSDGYILRIKHSPLLRC